MKIKLTVLHPSDAGAKGGGHWAVMNMSGLLGGCRAEDKSGRPGLGKGVRKAPVTGIVERERKEGRY